MTDDEIMDTDNAKEEKHKRDMWPQDEGWAECCKLCWYPVKECQCEKEKP